MMTLSMGLFLGAEELHVTGKHLHINGQSRIPRAMFGVHATPLSPGKVEAWGIESDRHITQTPHRGGPRSLPDDLPHAVECQWDRYQPALIVQYGDWKDRLRDAAQKAAARVKASPRPLVIEFWNEPYLNWGVRPGVNYDGRFYQTEEREENGPMTLHYADAPLEHLRWTRQTVAVHAEKGHIDYLATRYRPKGREPGDTWTWRDRLYRAETRPWGKDVTQETFWPGKQNVAWYLEMLKVYAPALKQAHPDALLVAGWDFHIHQNGYAAWEDVHKPTIDAAIPWIDGYTEHHYGGDTRLVAASYEVANTYARTRHDTFLKIYNTEAGGDLDPERPGPAQPGYNTTAPEVRDRAHYTYMMRDVLHLLDKSPDKAAARAAHEAHHGKGVETAFRMLKPLRGKLMEARSPREDLWIVAALEDKRLTVAVFNDSRGTIEMPLRVTAPRGTMLQSVVARKPDGNMRIRNRETSWRAPSAEQQIPLRLKKRESVVYTFPLTGHPEPDPIRRTQYPAREILQSVPKNETLSWTLALPADDLERAHGAGLRVVQSGFTPGKHLLRVNGTSVDLRPGGIGIADIVLPPSRLRTENTIEIERLPGSKWCAVQAVSLFLENESSPRNGDVQERPPESGDSKK